MAVPLAVVTVAATPEQASADPGASTLTWKWGGEPDGPDCTISASIGSVVTAGKVHLSGRFHGCAGDPDLGRGDGVLSVTGTVDGRDYGGSTPWCPETCSYVAELPFTGAGTYCGLVFYFDFGYVLQNGHDPSIRPCRYISGVAPVFPPEQIPPPPVGVPQPPPPPNPQPAPCPQVSSLSVVPDGMVLQTCDTGRMYKMVGGAPLWLTTCDGGMCPGTPIKVTQAIVDAGLPFPRDAATATDEGGNIFKFVGGAPIHLSSCTVGCGTPIRVPAGTLQLVHPANHLRQRPIDAATARDEAGHVFKFVGGAPIHLSSCAVGCGRPVPVNGWSVANLDHMNAVPTDGATAKDEAGNIFKFVGGAPIHLSSCSVGCGNPVPITAWSIVHYEHMRSRPADGATAKDEAGNIFKFVGGAPIHLSNCSVGCGNPVPINGWSVATLEHMNPTPANGATAKDEAGNIFKFVGGAPIHLSNCSVGCGNPVPINGWSVATLEHMNPTPANGATAKDEAGNIFKFVGGAPILLSGCAVSCGSPVPINGWSVATLEHMRATPTDGSVVRDERGRTFKFAGGAPLPITNCVVGCAGGVTVTAHSVNSRDHMRVVPVDGTRLVAGDKGNAQYRVVGGVPDAAGTCPSAAGCATAVAVNGYTVGHLLVDGTRVKDAGSSGQAGIVGGALVAFHNMDELNGAGYGTKPLLVIPNRMWTSLSTRPEDGTRLKDSGSSGQAVIIGGAKITFATPQEVYDTGYDAKPLQVVPNRVWNGLPTQIADGTRLKDSGSSGQAVIIGGAKITFATPQEVYDTGYDAKPLQVIANRVWNGLPTQIEGRTLIKKPSAPTVAMVLNNTRVDYTDQQEVNALGCADRPTQMVPARVFDAISNQPDRLYPAATRAVDLGRITPTPSWRKNCFQIFRADNRDPAENFANGFHPLNLNGQYNLREYVLNKQPSPFVSTTYYKGLYSRWKPSYYYCIDAPSGIDVNETIGSDHEYAWQVEVAFPGGVDHRFIVGAWPYNESTGQLGSFTRNTNYDGNRSNEWCTANAIP
ncbi:scabin-related ADP-ribosyltransferase [Micromonospora sp. CPCC 206061]|uniref:scabin-related ADP-ribosyltransferase n=1 Tax=Micromonospora sp. CPCC 206061 TaxID=3122410 RepID=UPI002FF37BF7